MAERKFNFSPGPAMLPTEVMEQVQKELLDWQGYGISSMEDTHRGARFTKVMDRLEANYREILSIPDSSHLIFAQGGATMQSTLLPLNLLGDSKESTNAAGCYVVTGAWSEKAHKEAAVKWNAPEVMNLDAERYCRFPEIKEFADFSYGAYLHYCNNETIHGVFGDLSDADVGVPLICDASSCIMGRDIDMSKHDMVYAGAQKNLGPAGIAVTIISDDLLQKCRDDLPMMFSWKKQVADKSMQNTAPTFILYVMDLVAQWTKDRGGVAAMEQENRLKSDMIYAVIDGTDFYSSQVAIESRSIHNIPFVLADDNLNDAFLQGAEQRGLVNLKGHRAVGGMRASMYNSMPVAGAEALASYMQDFVQANG